MRFSIIFSLALTSAPIAFSQAPAGYYDTQRIVWYDQHDKQGSPWLWGSVDKRQHFAAGALAGSLVALYAERQGWRHPWWWGFLSAMALGIVKEVCDHQRWGFTPIGQHGGSGTAEIMDAVWTGAGGGAAAYLVRVPVRW